MQLELLKDAFESPPFIVTNRCMNIFQVVLRTYQTNFLLSKGRPIMFAPGSEM